MKKIGFKPTDRIKLIRWLTRLIIKMLRLDGVNMFSNELIQSLDPKNSFQFREEKFYFRTGHGRLNWRVNSFFSEEPLIVEWLEEMKENDIFLDIGANVGTYTIPTCAFVKKCYAVELDFNNIQLLFDNLHMNKLSDKCLILPFPLHKDTSVQDIYYRDFSKGDALQSVSRPSPFLSKSEINSKLGFTINQLCFSLDDIFDIFDLDLPNKIKIDVDGNEEFVINGGRKIIMQAQEVYFESNGLDDQSDNNIINEFKNNGFKIIKQMKSVNVAFENSKNILFKKIKN